MSKSAPGDIVSGDSPCVEIHNESAEAVSLDFYLNEKGLFSDTPGIVNEILQSDLFFKHGFPFAAWKWFDFNYYDDSVNPYSAATWQHAPYLFINSLGFGLCDDVASVYYAIATSFGYKARIWMIEGHVVPEVFVGGAWELYDPNLDAVYINSAGAILGYDDISTNYQVDYEKNLRNSGYAEEVKPASWAYADSVVGLYQTIDNNVLSHYSMAPQAPFKKAEQLITLPPSSFLRIHDYEEEVLTIYQDIVPQVSVLEVHFGSVSEFEFFYPLVPISISGQGVAIIDGVEYTIGSAALSERFSDRENPIYSIAVTTIGDKNAISYLLNPVRFSLDGVMDVDVVSGEETLSVLISGDAGNDVLIGAGGADTLIGGQGDDRLTQTAVTLNDAAGSRLKGGSGDDRLVFEGSQAYTSNYVTLLGDEGADVISAGVLQSQYVGAMQVDGGSGDDLIEVGHIEGSTGGRGYLAGGEDNDVLRVLDTWNGIGIWGNSTFKLMGDAGDDRFDLAGRQLNIVGNDQGAQLDGGAGFDSLAWNGRYNLTINGHQNPSLGLYAGYKQELKVSNVENVDLVAGGATGLTVKFTELDVMTITAGSDFDRSTLGLGLSGTGNTLFVNAASNEVDVTGLVNLGGAFVNGQEYGLYQVGGAYLGVLTDMTLSGTPVGETLRGYGGNDILIGAGGADTLIGGQGDDRLQGEEGADILFGGEGVDRLEGGAGSDLFVFFSVTDSCLVGHYDAILDFISGYDLIDLSGIDANDTTLGNQAFDFVSTADFSGAAGELRFDSNYGLLSGDTNGDSFSDFGISLAGRTSLASSDILL